MNTDRVDVAIKEVEQTLPQPTTQVENAVTEQSEVPEVEAPKAEEQVKQKPRVEFPKEAVKAISRREQKIGKLHAEKQQLLSEVQKLREAQAQSKPQNIDPNAPREEDYESYGDFLEAKIEYKLNKNQAEKDKTNQTSQEQQFERRYIEERVQVLDKTEAELKTHIPDYDEVVDEYEDLISEATPQLRSLFLSADNPPLAFYNLAKNGKLESLLNMPLNQAAIEIGRALAMGIPQPKKISSAPTPIKAASGSGTGSKTIESMNPNELREWLKS